MPKFYCEYCGIYLTHSSPSGRKQHSKGKKHETARQDYYRAVMQDLVEQLKSCFQKNMIPTFISRDTIRRLLIKHQQDFAGLSTTAFVETIESLRLGSQMQVMMPPQMGGMMQFGGGQQGMLPPQGLPHMIQQGPLNMGGGQFGGGPMGQMGNGMMGGQMMGGQMMGGQMMGGGHMGGGYVQNPNMMGGGYMGNKQ